MPIAYQAGGAHHAPIDLMRMESQAALAAASPREALVFAMECLSSLPTAAPSMLALFASLFLQPLKATVPDACHALMAVADAPQQRVLHRLGCIVGEDAFLSSFAASVHGKHVASRMLVSMVWSFTAAKHLCVRCGAIPPHQAAKLRRAKLQGSFHPQTR